MDRGNEEYHNREEVKEGERDYFRWRPEDMDWAAVSHGILRYER